jgi:hypothetical protein
MNVRAWCTLSVVALMLAAAPAAQSPGRDGLVGAWTLNFDETSTPPDVEPADEAPIQRPRAGMGGFGGGAVGPGRMGGSGADMRPSGRERQQMRALLRRAGDAPLRLTVVLDGARVLLTDGLGRTASLPTNNRKQKIVTADGEADVRARWDGDALQVEEDFGSRMKLTYRYAVVSRGEARQLHVLVRVSGGPSGRDGRGVPDLRRVYDPGES